MLPTLSASPAAGEAFRALRQGLTPGLPNNPKLLKLLCCCGCKNPFVALLDRG